MATLAAIQKQIADLEKQAESIRKGEAAVAVTKVKELIARHNLTAEDVGLAAKVTVAGKTNPTKKTKTKAAVGVKTAGIPKYRDPKTGKTWTGNGKAPGWIAGAKNRDAFLISASSSAAAQAPAAASSAKKTRAPAIKTAMPVIEEPAPVLVTKKVAASKPAEAAVLAKKAAAK